ncbi:Phenylacetate-CoA oxygenase, PaaJ subunit [Fulvivirga imtechensis AK7]|uniref:Phenylacetate-CoA oxygenase, PaaJ subunit n=1 Tax=Fulvivirga imtechensis AK7 TaxID=1237149 RepID=L8JQ22_9BACT|nr:1,2-phenylacetyl-CoA epoxidase subunit PaaD [Fulvivirga imtechensis]ELR69599.1 Phenylacetate-CoA oxygenase, PaaJ subunit [Fulvivirga imtechensis AK7]
MEITEKKILEWLEEVKDPEIPVLSLVDLGVITGIDINEHRVRVTMTPTFVGCPAIDYMKQDIIDVLNSYGIDHVDVVVSFEKSWNSNMITEKGRKALKDFGLAPPPKHNLIVDIDILEHIECPNCGSTNTILKTPFGPTACRSIHHCSDCKETFEQFKPV